jgi:5-formyltetrahydrofolate cyclo-ligase
VSAASVEDVKQALREEVWDALSAARVARFPGARGRIPNFTGAEAAAQRLATTAVWQAAATIKSNPDSPQWPVRQRALKAGKTVFMAVPRLRDEHPFMRLEPGALDVSPRTASSIKGSSNMVYRQRLTSSKPLMSWSWDAWPSTAPARGSARAADSLIWNSHWRPRPG